MSSECSSIPDAKFFNEKYHYPKWFTRKKMMFHNKMLKRLRKLRFLHSRSSQYYDKLNLRLSAPSIIITSISGIASFLSTSQYVNSDSQNAFGITVGVLASLSSIFQALSAACQYSVKREAHRTVAEQYNALIVKTKFEMEMPNEKDFIDNLEISILDIQAKCNYFVPQFIIDEWTKQDHKELIDKYNYNIPKKQNDNDVNISIFTDDFNDTNDDDINGDDTNDANGYDTNDDYTNDTNDTNDANGYDTNDDDINGNDGNNEGDDGNNEGGNINIDIEQQPNPIATENTYLLKQEQELEIKTLTENSSKTSV